MRVVYPKYPKAYPEKGKALICGHTVNLKAFTSAFWEYTGDHLQHFQALPAEFEYDCNCGETVVFDTYGVIGDLLAYGIDMPVPELVE